MPARRVGRATRQRQIAAQHAEPEPIAVIPPSEPSTADEWPPINVPTPRSGESGFTGTSSESVNEFLISKPSAKPSPPSTRRWKPPINVRQFAAQTNAVATMVLRGEMDLETARVYSGLARTVAQAMSTEVSRARFLAQEPDLSLEEEDPEA